MTTRVASGPGGRHGCERNIDEQPNLLAAIEALTSATARTKAPKCVSR
jgi:hypothetical protein